MKNTFLIPSLLACFLFVALNAQQKVNPNKQSQSDTAFISYSSLPPLSIPRNKLYHQTLTIKLFLSQAMFDGQFKRKDNETSLLALSFAEALDVIKRIDNLTLGIPKIVYLVGWQYNGHDSKYPAWFEGNEKLKRPEDKTAIESIKWLMGAANQYHTTVSLHINMFDAYEDSPLWDQYLDHDIIAKNIDGSTRSGEWGYPISYAQEWALGFAQKRIDSLCALLPIQDAGTIHIDAFHTWPPIPVKDNKGNYQTSLDKGVISPYLKFSIEDETEAQRNIFRYWAKKGIDVTSEGVDFLRASSFEGYQPMGWWFGGLDNYLKWPASYYCGGQDNSEWGKLFGTSMHAEDIVKRDPKELSGFKEQFCLNTVIWYFLNQLERSYLLTQDNYKALQYSNGVRVSLFKDEYRISQNNSVLVENGDMMIPANWISDDAMIAYSKKGYQNRTWQLPERFMKIRQVKIYRVSQDGNIFVQAQKVKSGRIILSMQEDEMFYIK
jgi:hypothetical protein